MAKNFTHLKPSVFQAYDQGKSALEVMRFFKIPRSTAYDWHKEHRESKLLNPTPLHSPPKNPETTQEPTQIVLSGELLEHSRPFTVIDGGRSDSDLSDFQLARRVLREVANDPNERRATRLQAALGLLRLLPVKAELPRHILEDTETSSLQAERKKLEGLSAEELAKLYKEELDATKKQY